MAMLQTDSEPPVAEKPVESLVPDPMEDAAESPAESPAKSADNEDNEDNASATGYASALRTEQQYVTMLYGLLDQARERSEQELTAVRARGSFGGTHQARLERDVSAAEHERRLAQLNLTE